MPVQTQQMKPRPQSKEPSGDPANDYVPQYMDEGEVQILGAGGNLGVVASVPQCLKYASVPDLISALNALDYSNISYFPYWPFQPGPGTIFSETVPWLVIVDPATGYAFLVNAGVYANFWNHGVNPFVGSSYEKDLRADVAWRGQMSSQGYPMV